jgi:NADPH:quinone reductase-like Zn-dependent oxidoreductase
METMQAARMHNYGGAEVLRLEEAPLPSIGPDEVLVRVHAAGVNPVDWKVREGQMRGALEQPLPLIPGWDISGVVEAVGERVNTFEVGDEVYSRPDINRNGGYAEYIAVRADEVARKPRTLSHIEAAGVPLAALTAWQALFVHANLNPGQRVLVHAAAGGVGSFAAQLARTHGAYVYGTASGANLNFMHEIGVNHPIDYTREDFTEIARDLDIVLDTLGGEAQERSWPLIKPGGMLVSVVDPTVAEKAKQYQVGGEWFLVQPNAQQLNEIAALIDNGEVRVRVEQVFPLTQVKAAHELSQSGHARGKIVLQVH